MRWKIMSSAIVVGSACFLVVVLYLIKKRRSRQPTIECGRNTALPSRPILDISDYKLVILEDESSCEQYFAQHIQKHHYFLGLDCEWVSGRGKERGDTTFNPVALLQLAFPDMECALIRLCKIGKITPSLAGLLQDRSVLKFGVGISNDVHRLSNGFQIVTEGTIDLRNLALRCGVRRNSSLAGLTNQIVGRDLVKVQEITCSNWEQHVLSTQQIHYAVSDAIAALLILSGFIRHKLSNKRGHWDGEEVCTYDFSTEASTSYELTEATVQQQLDQADNHLDLLLTDKAVKCVHSLCQGLVGTEYKRLSKENVPLATGGMLFSAGRSNAYSVRKTPLYHNCQLIAPDGTLLSTVDQKKVNWYISKNLGVLVSEDPPTVRLLFEPSGKPNKDREYYLAEKDNVCVVCGKNDGYIRKNVIPHEYRKHFPKEKKEHVSHDVLLLCVSCHQLSDNYDRFMRRDLSLEYGVPLDAGTQKYREDQEKVRRRSLARAMNGQRRLPDRRRSEILESFAEYFECKPDEVTPEMLKEIGNSETRTVNEDFVSHGELVVKAVMEREELLDFQRKWRVHFVDCMKPRFLPKLWSVDHNPRS